MISRKGVPPSPPPFMCVCVCACVRAFAKLAQLKTEWTKEDLNRLSRLMCVLLYDAYQSVSYVLSRPIGCTAVCWNSSSQLTKQTNAAPD